LFIYVPKTINQQQAEKRRHANESTSIRLVRSLANDDLELLFQLSTEPIEIRCIRRT
jgi:hypothetical protein